VLGFGGRGRLRRIDDLERRVRGLDQFGEIAVLDSVVRDISPSLARTTERKGRLIRGSPAVVNDRSTSSTHCVDCGHGMFRRI
jgi:hypothetical protein